MSEEIKEFALVSEEAPKFDPTKKYTWPRDTQIVISGAEFGVILNALRAVTTTPEAQAIFLAAEAANKIEDVLVRSVETGVFTELTDTPKNSL